MESLDLARTRFPDLGSSDDLSSMTVDTGQVVVNNSLNGNGNQLEMVVMAGIVLLASSLFIFTGIITYFATIKCYTDYRFKRKRVVNRLSKIHPGLKENTNSFSYSASTGKSYSTSTGRSYSEQINRPYPALPGRSYSKQVGGSYSALPERSYSTPTGRSYSTPTGRSYSTPTGRSYSTPTGRSYLEQIGRSNSAPPGRFTYYLEKDEKRSLSPSVLNRRYMDVRACSSNHGKNYEMMRENTDHRDNPKITLSPTKLNSRYTKKNSSTKRVYMTQNRRSSASSKNVLIVTNPKASFQTNESNFNIISGNLNLRSEGTYR